MSSSQFNVSPVQSQSMQVGWASTLVAIGLIAGAALAILFAQNLSMGSSAAGIEMIVPDNRLVFPHGSSWHTSPSLAIDSRTAVPNGSVWFESPSLSIDSRTAVPNGSVWHTSPSREGSIAMDSRMTNAHGTSWFQSAGGGE